MSQPSPAGGPGDVDAELARLDTAVAAVAANLVDLDTDPAKQSLDKGPLAGRTQTTWGRATEAVAQLWEQYSTLTDLLDKAKKVRGQRRLSSAEETALAELVLGPSVTLATTTIPVTQRGLLGAGQTTTTCTPAALLTAMEATFAEVRTTIVTAGDVWARLLTPTAAAAEHLAAVRAQADAAHTQPAALADADRRLNAFMKTLATDPLAVQESDLNTITQLIETAAAELSSATDLLAELKDRLAGAHTLADQISQAEQRAVDAAALAAEKLTAAHVVPVTPDRRLATDLAALDALATAGQWQLLTRRLAGWRDRADARLAALEQACTRNTAAVNERNELRGRLSAYQAKAARLGGGEDPALSRLYQAARTELYTAPCDLTAAHAALHAYQTAVTVRPTSTANHDAADIPATDISTNDQKGR